MLSERYLTQLTTVLRKYLKSGQRAFIFGSSVEKEDFDDIDVGLIGPELEEDEISKAREEIEESMLPYKVDLINFNLVGKDFEQKVFKEEIIWLI